MSRKAEVYNNGVTAGILEKNDENVYVFTYNEKYIADPDTYPVSLSFPKSKQVYSSEDLFPFFFGLLSEGVNRQIQSRLLRIDENDHFSLLLATGGSDTIGSVTIKEITG